MGFLVDLGKYTQYSITVLCFTSKGNGPLSTPVLVRTLEDGELPERNSFLVRFFL